MNQLILKSYTIFQLLHRGKSLLYARVRKNLFSTYHFENQLDNLINIVQIFLPLKSVLTKRMFL